ncbi:hypothetical protein [Rubrivirga sp.]|uniref:hypothetical protein n=1 Tax=Rubrivirga sp. TaxID=1885344 RepID=UPI003B5155B2
MRRFLSLLALAGGLAASAQTGPTVRPLAIGRTVGPEADAQWTVVFDEPSRSGGVNGTVVGSAPDGGVCLATEEAVAGNVRGVVVARYGPDGAERWAVPVDAWASAGASPLSVVAVGEACVAGATVGPFASQRAEVARVSAAGTEWVRTLDPARQDRGVSRLPLVPDGVGGVWASLGTSNFVPSGLRAPVVRFDASGTEVARTTLPMFGNDRGAQALAARPDGGVVVLANQTGLVRVDPSGAATTGLFGGDFEGTALALVGDTDALVLGTTGAAGGTTVMRRLRPDGTAVWETALGANGERDVPAFVSADNLATDGDAVYAAWQDPAGQGLRVARLGATGGATAWSVLAGTPSASAPRGLAIDAGGVAFVSAFGDAVWGALAAADGAPRWSVLRGGVFVSPQSRSLVPCAEGGSCVAVGGVLTARDAAGGVLWTVTRQGERFSDTRLWQTAAAPTGGVFVAGLLPAQDGVGTDPFVGRIAPDGRVAWTAAVDGGGTSDPPVALVPTSDGGVVVASTTFGSARRATVAAFDADGTPRWATWADGDDRIARALAATDGGGVVVAVDEILPNGLVRTSLLRFDRDGSEVWRAEVPDEGSLFALGVAAGPQTVTVAQFVFGSVSTLRADRFDVADGTRRGREETAGRDGCGLTFEGLSAAEDDRGVLHVVVSQSNGPSSCARALVFRFPPAGGIEATYTADAFSGPARALDVSGAGNAAVVYGPGRVALIDADGTLVGDDPAPDGLSVTGVAVGDALEFLLTATDGSLTPILVGSTRSGGFTSSQLPLLVGLPTEASLPVIGADRAGYAALRTTPPGMSVAGVSRVDMALPVAAEAFPASTAMLTVLGPQPAPVGGTVRLRLGTPARLTLFDAVGRRVSTWEARVGEATVAVPTAAGVYLLRAEADGQASTVPLVVVR